MERFSKDIRSMLGFDVGWWWKFCWVFCAPLFLMTIIVYGLISFEPLTYDNYVYPFWANALGLVIAASSVLCIPVVAIYQYWSAPGNWRQKLTHIITPYSESHSRQTQVPMVTSTSIVIQEPIPDDTSEVLDNKHFQEATPL